MEEDKKVKLFREKSLEAIESPESLNDYLRVTSPGVWLVMAAVIALLVGGILWGILGRIETSVTLAVVARDGKTVCYVPYDVLADVNSDSRVNIEGKDYALNFANADVAVISEDMNPFVLLYGSLKAGDMTAAVVMDTGLSDGVYPGRMVTESLRPISLLLQ